MKPESEKAAERNHPLFFSFPSSYCHCIAAVVPFAIVARSLERDRRFSVAVLDWKLAQTGGGDKR